MKTCISAVQHLRSLRSGAQSHLLRASDGYCYVTKFQNNPLGTSESPILFQFAHNTSSAGERNASHTPGVGAGPAHAAGGSD